MITPITGKALGESRYIFNQLSNQSQKIAKVQSPLNVRGNLFLGIVFVFAEFIEGYFVFLFILSFSSLKPFLFINIFCFLLVFLQLFLILQKSCIIIFRSVDRYEFIIYFISPSIHFLLILFVYLISSIAYHLAPMQVLSVYCQCFLFFVGVHIMVVSLDFLKEFNKTHDFLDNSILSPFFRPSPNIAYCSFRVVHHTPSVVARSSLVMN